MKKITAITIAFSAITLALNTSIFANPVTPGTPAAYKGKMMEQKREHRRELRHQHKEQRMEHRMDKMQKHQDRMQKHHEKMMQKRQHRMQLNHPDKQSDL